MRQADPKPAKRVRDKDVLALFHSIREGCLSCTWQRPAEAHHVLSRAQGGDDVMNNLVPLCANCHGQYHAGDRSVRHAIARFLRSDAGVDHIEYLNGKLEPTRGAFAVEAFVQRLER